VQPDSPTQQKQREAERLESLALWLKRYGHTVESLQVRTNDIISADSKAGYVAWRSDAVRQVVQAVAAAGRQKGALPLQALRLPAIGGTDPDTLSSALFVCPYLRYLRLDYCYGDETIHPVSYLGHEVTSALYGLQHLTHLKVTLSSVTGYICGTPETKPDLPDFKEEADPFMPYGSHYWPSPSEPYLPDPFPLDRTITMDAFFARLPPSLQQLELAFHQNPAEQREFYVKSCNLEHLVNLRSLELPANLHVTKSDNSGGPLLPSLMVLDYMQALTKSGGALLPLPRLEGIKAGWADAARLWELARMPSLKGLSCHAVLAGDGSDSAAALAQLTQVTHLVAPVVAGDGVVPAAVTHWAAALSSLKGLRSLTLQAELLELVDISCFPVLNRIVVDVRRQLSTWYPTATSTEQLLLRLAPARGRLQGVMLQGVAAEYKLAYCRAVFHALGPVKLSCVS
jgi:hypothetical protein